MHKINTKLGFVYRTVLVCLWALCCLHSAQGQIKTETALVQAIVQALRTGDNPAYQKLFLPADSMAQITIRKAPAQSDAYQYALSVLHNPYALSIKDSLVSIQVERLFREMYQRGEKMNINWDAIIMSRYELEKMPATRNAVLEAIAPERFMGYVSFEDQLSRHFFMFNVSDMMKIENNWYGGELNFLFEAQNKDEFNHKMKLEKIRIAKGLPDTLGNHKDSVRKAMIANGEIDDIPLKRKQVSDRKFYFGYLDDEIPIRLYIRAIKGDCGQDICSWEAIIRLGDDEYLRQEVTKNNEGKWVFTENVLGGVLEVELKNNIFEGIFSETNDRIDYDAYLKEKNISKSRMEELDSIIEKDLER